jgi:flagellar basal body-associated protein FliL
LEEKLEPIKQNTASNLNFKSKGEQIEMKKRIIAILIAIVVMVLFYFVLSFVFKPGGSKNMITNNSESAYQQNIKIQYPQISKSELFTHNGHLVFNYILKNNTNQKKIYEIFQKNYEFISNDKLIQILFFNLHKVNM